MSTLDADHLIASITPGHGVLHGASPAPMTMAIPGSARTQARSPSARVPDRLFSNLDDMHENGLHERLSFVKFGYGRGSDHSCKDIRYSIMTREQEIEMVCRYDHVKPRRDLDRWFSYVDLTEEELDGVTDTFRDPRVWRIVKGRWVKDTIWGAPTAYDAVDPAALAPAERRTVGAGE